MTDLDPDLRTLLADDVDVLLARHVHKAKEWFPHEFREPTDPDAALCPPESASALASALYVNLLTEDNLPAYTSEVDRWFGREGPWAEWTRRWTAEEGRHSIAMREWIHATGIIDPYELERARMAVVLTGVADHGIDGAQALVYVSIQELATRTAHANTGRLISDHVGHRLMTRIAVDENLHFLFYRDLVTAFIDRAPSTAVMAIESVVRSFRMPGTGIVGFRGHADAMAAAGIYSWTIHLRDVLTPLLRSWRVEHLEALDPQAEAARDRLMQYVARLGRISSRMSDMAASGASPAS